MSKRAVISGTPFLGFFHLTYQITRSETLQRQRRTE